MAQRVMIVMGTRPEVIKLAPVIAALRAEPTFEPFVCATGQHREMLDQALTAFGIAPEFDLAVMQAGQTLNALAARLLAGLDEVIAREQPSWVMVQGDTTTTMVGALAAFHRNVRVAHVEAGLRTGDMRQPFPEEMNRRIAALATEAHFAPTQAARLTLLQEGVAAHKIRVTGNTGIDSLLQISRAMDSGLLPAPALIKALDGRRLVLATAHRRESFEGGLQEICAAIRELVARLEDIEVVLPVHPNPHVVDAMRAELGDCARVRLVAPQDYHAFVGLLRAAVLVLSDSGGVQEECAALGKPLLVMRAKTERPEAIEGGARLVGVKRDAILGEAMRLLLDRDALAAAARPSTAFGDGQASLRIANILRDA